MPLEGARYRVKTTKSGKRVRLAFKGGRVVEAKNIDTGATHTPAEFAADRRKARSNRTKSSSGLRSRLRSVLNRFRRD